MAEAKTKSKAENKPKKAVSEKETVKAEKPQKLEKNSNDFAVIRTGGKQYLVKNGTKLDIEKLEIKEGDKVVFDDVLLREAYGKLEVGNPTVSGAKVEGKVLAQHKGDKIVVFKYKKRKNYRRKQGHRQNLTQVEIVKV